MLQQQCASPFSCFAFKILLIMRMKMMGGLGMGKIHVLTHLSARSHGAPATANCVKNCHKMALLSGYDGTVDVCRSICSQWVLCPFCAAVADPETSERGGPRNMKYKLRRAAAIFFGLFLQARGGMAPLAPLDPLLCGTGICDTHYH